MSFVFIQQKKRYSTSIISNSFTFSLWWRL